jgi:tyrosyl-tRNA synthetase
MGFLETMREREMLAQITHEDELVEHLATGSRFAYVGFDPTADSLHVGHLMAIMALRRWQKAGHKVLALVGGGTGLIGDPSGKTDMRQMLTAEVIDTNIQIFKKQLAHFINFSDGSALVNNADWLNKLMYLPLLREVGPHFSVNRMLTADCFRLRLEKGLSFLEFNYMILQSYDFLHLQRTYGCTLQLGGDDQWSNMLGGVELIRRLSTAKAFCVTVPLLTTSAGTKMGKTEKGAVWLDGSKTPPYDYFQYWRNVEDSVVRKCLLYFTELPVAEINALTAVEGSALNQAKERLAYECTTLLHGREAADAARAAAANLFGEAHSGAGAPEHVIAKTDLKEGGISLADALVSTKIFASKSEVRRLVQQGGLMLDGNKVEDPEFRLTEAMLAGEGILLRKGKKHYYRLRI